MTRIEFKFKIPYGAIREAHFQTATRLSLKKKKEEEERNAIPYKKKQPLIHGTKETKKKKKSKTLKPKSYLPIKIQIHSDYRFFAIPSNT